MATGLQGSEIIKLAGEIKKKIAAGQQIYNFTIGDFNPEIFPIPNRLNELIQESYAQGMTNYPAANGMEPLRQAVSSQVIGKMGLDYTADEVLISGGARPLIYATYQALIDPSDSVIFPVPSWNNNHYTHLSRGKAIYVETSPENNFMPTATDLVDHIGEASLIAVCSPLNPTGTVFSREQLKSICDLVVEENRSRQNDGRKPVYLMFDQIYWQLTYGKVEHHDPVNLCPDVRPYTIYIDGLSKAFAATGVRVGWAFGPAHVINKMKAILGHIGAWAPKAEQMATAKYLNETTEVSSYINWIRKEAVARLDSFYQGFEGLREKGYAVRAIAPQAAIYLTVSFDLKGKMMENGQTLDNTEAITLFLLEEAGLAIVPFYAFGSTRDSVWYRLSIGTAKMEEIPQVFERLESALSRLK
ncbi:MAG: aminotransferase class I/II-fold pyridoxal phosphate-dependent enzyme [Flavobacteriales bacterium]|nr:aminotransferase class I/II-fold pyridoxal phosphate-dependent enzyme [Flavobacteriales bacterium]